MPLPAKYNPIQYNNPLSSVVPNALHRSYAVYGFIEMTEKSNILDRNMSDIVSIQLGLKPAKQKTEK